MKISNSITALLLMLLLMASCRKDQWDQRNEITDALGAETLMDKIAADTSLSLFAGYLGKTGYDKVLASSKTFTVWAPNNTALRNVNPDYLADSSSLKAIIGNCIANQSFYSVEAKDSAIRIRTFRGKRVLFTGDSLNGIQLIQKDITAKNGVLYTIGTAILPQQSAFEYLESSFSNSLQFGYLKKLFYSGKIDSLVRDSLVKANVIIPDYNTYMRRININSEDSLLTYIILTDNAYQSERQKLDHFFVDSTVAVSDSVSQFNIIKDLTVNGVVMPNAIPETIYSVGDSLAIHLRRSQIVSSAKVSNGIVYVVNALDYDLATKIKPVTVQGEQFLDRLDNTKGYTIRKRRNPANDSIFRDVYMANFGVSSFWIRYPVTLDVVTYKVYWRAVNDFQTGTFPMRLALNHHIDTAFADPKNIQFDFTLPYTEVGIQDYSDVYVGDFTPSKHGLADLFLIGNSTTSNGKNTIVCDYIKLVPVLN